MNLNWRYTKPGAKSGEKQTERGRNLDWSQTGPELAVFSAKQEGD